LDFGPNSLHGVNYGATYGEDSKGNPNAALSLNGISDFVDLSLFGPQFRENLNQITIIFKIRFLKESDGQEVLSLGVSGESLQTNIFQFEYENNRFQIETETGGDAINHELEVDQSESLLTGQWHRIMIVINGDNLTYCKDGEVVFQGGYIPAETLTNSFFLGCFSGTDPNECCYFGGLIDDLQFYSKTFDEEDPDYLCTPCADPNLELLVEEDFAPGEIITKQASVSITSTSTVNPGATVTFIARDEISLMPGFKASFGSEFSAFLTDCINDFNSNNQASLTRPWPDQVIRNDTTFQSPASRITQSRLRAAPNPFSTNTNISFQLEEASQVVVRISNLNGAIIETLIDGMRYEVGDHQINFESSDLPNGIYLVQLITENDLSLIQLVLSR
jgi:hypothetical protein